jgi:hypothetical protein
MEVPLIIHYYRHPLAREGFFRRNLELARLQFRT